MEDKQKRREPKKIKMPPLVDRSQLYDTLSFDSDTLFIVPDIKTLDKGNENNSQNNSQSIQQLESDQIN